MRIYPLGIYSPSLGLFYGPCSPACQEMERTAPEDFGEEAAEGPPLADSLVLPLLVLSLGRLTRPH